MNNKFKKILLGVSAPSLLLPLGLTAIVSCGNNEHMYDELAYRIKTDMLEEFIGDRNSTIKGITSVSRDTFHTKPICEYLMGDGVRTKGRIREIMSNVNIHKDDYNLVGDKPEDCGWNMYFDIPATDPSMASIILQCHTDMVWRHEDGFVGSNPVPKYQMIDGREVLQSIQDVEIQGKTQEKRSSLGADNGMGIALCLAIARNRNAFKHGKIRILLTTDEEQGISGAENVPHNEKEVSKNWFCDSETGEYIPYLLNLDLEDTLKTAMSCGGTLEAKWSKQFQLADVSNEWHAYDLCVKGLKGDYAPRAVVRGEQNAINIAFRLLQEINDITGLTSKIQIAKVVGKPGDENKISCTNYITEAHIYFFTKEEITGDIRDRVDEKKNRFYEAYSEIEKQLEISITDWEDELPKKALSFGDESASDKLINFVCALPFGAKEGTNFNTSCNIGAVRLDDGTVSTTPNNVVVQLMGRSSIEEDLGHDPSSHSDGFWQQFKTISNAVWENDDGAWESLGWTPLWKHKDDNILNEHLLEGAKTLKYDLKSYDEIGWFEVAYFDLHTGSKLHMGDLGFDIKHPHTINETIYLDTMDPTIKLTLYAIQNCPQISIPFDELSNLRKEEQYE